MIIMLLQTVNNLLVQFIARWTIVVHLGWGWMVTAAAGAASSAATAIGLDVPKIGNPCKRWAWYKGVAVLCHIGGHDVHTVELDVVTTHDPVDHLICEECLATSLRVARAFPIKMDHLRSSPVVSVPYPPGAWPNIKIFNSVLSHCLKPGERVEADNGYVGHANKIKCTQNDCNPVENLGIQSAARSHHETFNDQLKNRGILNKTYRHDIMAHGTVFYACAVITQLSVA
jgi:hypothetical protein